MNNLTGSGRSKTSYSSWFLLLVALRGIAFAGTVPARLLLSIALTQWVAKCLYEALLTPVTYFVVNFLKRHERVDAYDYAT